MCEEIKREGIESLKKSGKDYKEFVPKLWDTIKKKEAEDYLTLFKESPDFVLEFMIKSMEKMVEYLQICDPKEFLLVVEDNLPTILEKIEKYRIEKFADEIKDTEFPDKFMEKLPELFEELEKFLQKIDLEILNSYVKTLKDPLLDLVIPFLNKSIPSFIKLNKDLEEAFDKLSNVTLTIGFDLKDMDLHLKIAIDKGAITLGEGMENTDVVVELPTEAVLEGFTVVLSGSKMRMTGYLLGEVRAVRGSSTKMLKFIPFGLKLSRLISKNR